MKNINFRRRIEGGARMRSGLYTLALISIALSGCGGGGGTQDSNASAGGGATPTPTSTATSTPAPSPTPTPTPSPTGTGTATTRQQDMLAIVLAQHNAARAEVGTPPLAIDSDLNRQALAYAEELARTGTFQHSPSSQRQGQGENLWAGTAGFFGYDEMASRWIEEKRYFVFDRFPYVSTTGNWADVGHYTQIIWRDTTRLGCGIATGSGRDYLVCRYAPPGNVSGQYPY